MWRRRDQTRDRFGVSRGSGFPIQHAGLDRFCSSPVQRFAGSPVRPLLVCFSPRFRAKYPELRSRSHALHPERERKTDVRRRPRRHAAAVGAARRPQPQGHEVRLRHRPVRRLHGASARPGRAVVPDARVGGEGARSRRSRACRRTARIRCSAPGWRSTCRSAATARPARSCPRRRCWRPSRSRPTRTSTPR